MSAVKMQPLPFNSTDELVEAVREKRRESGFTLRPPTCLWELCKERRLSLTASERHEILSTLARIGVELRRARIQSRPVEEKGTIFPDKGTIFATLPTQPPKSQVIQEDLFPGMSRDYQDRPHRWPRRRR